LQYISRLYETLDGHYKTQSTLFSSDETLDLHLIICGDAAAPTCASTIYTAPLYAIAVSTWCSSVLAAAACWNHMSPSAKKIPIVTYIIAYQEQILLPNSY